MLLRSSANAGGESLRPRVLHLARDHRALPGPGAIATAAVGSASLGAAAAGAFATDEPVWQEHVGVRVVGLPDDSSGDVAGFIETAVDGFRKISIFFRMSRMIKIELNQRIIEKYIDHGATMIQ